jgi:hypothetical protein
VRGTTAAALAFIAFSCEVTAQAVGPDPDPIIQAAFASCTTDAQGYCTINHTLGVQPASLVLTPRIAAGGNAYRLEAVATTLTDTSFRVRAMSTSTASVNNTAITFFYEIAAASEAAPGPDFTYDVRLFGDHTSSGNRVGAVYNYQDPDNFYDVMFDPLGTAEMRKVVGGVVTRVGSLANYAGGGPDKWFAVQIVRSASTTTIKVNGVDVFTDVPQTEFANGLIGVECAWNLCRYDDVSLAASTSYAENFDDNQAQGWTSTGSTFSAPSGYYKNDNSSVAAAVAVHSGQAPQPPPFLWTGNYETGNFHQWPSCQSVGVPGGAASWCHEYAHNHYSLQIVTNVKRQGNFGAKFELHDGDEPFGGTERTEVSSSGTPSDALPGDERWYQFSTMFSTTFPSNHASQGWGVVNQWHDRSDHSPPMSMDVGWIDGHWVLRINRQSSPGVSIGSVVPWKTPLANGTWHDIKLHIKWSTDPDVGFVELWHNGVQQTLHDDGITGCENTLRCMVQTLTPGGDGVYFKQGIYRKTSVNGTAIVYLDGYVTATTEAALPAPGSP